jgi:hypothetical protein
MKSVPSKTHVSHWTAIQVTKGDEPTRTYELDRAGRINPTTVPRNPRRTLTNRMKPTTTFETIPKPLSLPIDLDDPFPLMRIDWDMPTEISGVSVVDLPMFKELDEEFGFC